MKLIIIIMVLALALASPVVAEETQHKHAVLKTQAVHAQMGKLYTVASHTWMGNPSHEEYSFTVNADGSVSPIKTSGTAGKNAVEVPPGTQAIIHTHPAGYKPEPGPGDVPAAQAANCPNYVLTQKELWVANPDGTTAKVGDVSWKHGQLDIKWKSYANSIAEHKSMTEEQARTVLVEIITNGDTNRDSNGRFATTGGSDKHAVLKTQAVHAQMVEAYKKAQPTFMPKTMIPAGQQAQRQEYSFTVDKDGKPTDISTSGTNDKNTVDVPQGSLAVVHTHPIVDSPTPSEADVKGAVATGVPDYVISHSEIYVANPDGTTAKVADIDFKKGDLVIKWKS